MRSLLPTAVVIALVGCTPTPEKVCAKLTEVAEKEGSLDNKHLIRLNQTCLIEMSEERRARPDFYKCHAKCLLEVAKSADAEACEPQCTVGKKKDGTKNDSWSSARKAVSVEAHRALAAIEKGSKNRYEQETDTKGDGTGPFVHTFCPSSSRPTPVNVPKGTKVTVPSQDWTDPTWTCLKFSINEPQACQYEYKSAGVGLGSTYTATATCDPDGDGRLLRVVLTGKGAVTGDAERVSLVVEGE
jgi:hypothetical protein